MAQLPISRQRWTPPAARIEGDRILKARAAQQRVRDAAVQAEAEAKVALAQEEKVLGEKVDDLEKTVETLIKDIPKIMPAAGGGRRTVKKILEKYYDLPNGLGSAAGNDTEDFATAAQGTKADSAVQPGDLATVAYSGSQDNMADGTTNKNYTATEKTKLADAVTKSDTSTAAMDFVLDEDDLASNSATKLPTQQSVKANIDSRAPKGRFGSVSSLETDTAFGYAGSGAQFIVADGDQVEAGGYRFEVLPAAASDQEQETAGSVKLNYVRRHEFITPAMFGNSGGGSTDDGRLTRALTAGSQDSIPVVIENDYVADVLDIPAAAGATLDITITGKISHVSAASDSMLKTGALGLLRIGGTGEVDGQYALQTGIVDVLAPGSVDRLVVEDITVRGQKRYGLNRATNSDTISTDIRRVKFLEGGLAGATTADLVVFLVLRGGLSNVVEDCYFIQTADPLSNAASQPCGLLYINTGATVGEGTVSIKRNHFHNLGTHKGGTLLSPCDFYSYADQIDVSGNKFTKSRITPIRVSSGALTRIVGNHIVQDVAQIQDGGSPYTDASCIAAVLTDRGYTTDDIDVSSNVIEQNHIRVVSQNCYGLNLSSGSTSNMYRAVTVRNNSIRSSGTNTFFGAFVNNVRQSIFEGGEIEGFSSGIRVQGTSNTTPLSSETNASLVVRDVLMKNNATGVYARDNIANLDIVLDNVEVEGASGNDFTVRNARTLTIANGRYGSLGDTSGNGNVVITGATIGALPTLTGNTAWSVRNCPGFADREKAQLSGLDASRSSSFTWSPGTSAEVQKLIGSIGSNQTVTLSTTNAVAGKTKARFVHRSTGGYSWDIGGLKTLTNGQWVDVAYIGSAYEVVAFGST